MTFDTDSAAERKDAELREQALQRRADRRSVTKTEARMAEQIAQLQSELAEARCELQEHQASFDLRWKADMRAIERWRTEPAEKGWNISLGIEQDPETGERKLKVGLPADRSLTMPDHADLCVWLLKQWERADAAEVKAETAERAERRRADTNEQARVLVAQAAKGYLDRAERAEARVTELLAERLDIIKNRARQITTLTQDRKRLTHAIAPDSELDRLETPVEVLEKWLTDERAGKEAGAKNMGAALSASIEAEISKDERITQLEGALKKIAKRTCPCQPVGECLTILNEVMADLRCSSCIAKAALSAPVESKEGL